jgi:Bacterial Ig-like domain (group 2)
MKTAKAALLVSLSLVLAFGLMMVGGCTSSSSDNGGTTPPPTATLVSIAVTPGTLTLSDASKTQAFKATGTYDDASTADLTTTAAWTSSDATKATVGATTGIATTVGAGTATITATSGTIKGTATLTVVPIYTGTVYMATETGGHIAIFDLSIDPTSTIPISVTNSGGVGDKKQLSGTPGNATSNINHDVRYDAAANKVYFSAIIPDDAFTSATLTRAHLGYYDVTGNTIVNDAKVDVDAGASATIMAAELPSTDLVVGLPLVYCASALETVSGIDYYTTLSMTVPAYIDTFKRSSITTGAQLVTAGTRTRFYVGDFRPNDLGHTNGAPSDVSLFAHGISSSPSGSMLYVLVNNIAVDSVVTTGSVSTYPSFGSPTGFGLNVAAHPVGAFTAYLLKMSDVVAGTVSPSSIILSNTISGMGEFMSSAPTVGFRSSFTPDGTKILQAGKDRFMVLNATTLVPITAGTSTQGDKSIATKSTTGTTGSVENHDAMSTPDSKYAILTIRYADSTTGGFQTGGLQLYDLTAMKAVGPVTPVCSACHAAAGVLDTADHHLCGIDGKLTAQ